MQTILDSADRPAHDAFVEKKSEFIGDACHIDSLDDALAFVAMIREKHPKARHVAYAVVCGGSDGRLAERMSDDGEPSGTAGKPILDVLRANEMTDCVVAVTRYFGGIQLGSFQNLLASVQGEQVDAQYTDRIAMRAIVPQEHAATFESRMIETFNAAVTPELVGTTNRPVKL